MKTTLLATGFALSVGIGAALAQTTPSPSTSGSATGAMQMTQAQCDSLWNKVDASNSGNVTQAQAQSYVADFKSADANNDGKLSSTEFRNACARGIVKDTATTGSGSGTSGSSTMGTTGTPSTGSSSPSTK